MKTIILVRHGKSSWELDVSDRNRPLKIRGKNDSSLVSNELERRSAIPKMIFSSPANRALSTCKIFTKHLGILDSQVTVVEELYDFEGTNVVNFIKSLSDDFNQIMIFGHNHALTSISNTFGSTFIDNLPTSGLVKINIDINNWLDLKQGVTEFIITPKELR